MSSANIALFGELEGFTSKPLSFSLSLWGGISPSSLFKDKGVLMDLTKSAPLWKE